MAKWGHRMAMKWSSWMGVCWDPQKWLRNIWLTFEIERFLFLLTWNRGVGERGGQTKQLQGKRKKAITSRSINFLRHLSPPSHLHQQLTKGKRKFEKVFSFFRFQESRWASSHPNGKDTEEGNIYIGWKTEFDNVTSFPRSNSLKTIFYPQEKHEDEEGVQYTVQHQQGASQQVVEQVADSILLVGHFPTSQYFVTTSDTASILELNLE